MLSSDPRAWEQLTKDSSPEPTSGRETSDTKGGPFPIGETLRYTTVATTEDIYRVYSKLVALRDAVLVPVYSSTEDSTLVFGNFEAKNSSRSNRWDGWQMLPPWSVYSLRDCPLSEVRVLLGVLRRLFSSLSVFFACSSFLLYMLSGCPCRLAFWGELDHLVGMDDRCGKRAALLASSSFDPVSRPC